LGSIKYNFLKKIAIFFLKVSQIRKAGVKSTHLYKCSFFLKEFLLILLCKKREKAWRPKEISTHLKRRATSLR